MSVLAELNKTSLELRKNRDELAKSLSVVVSNANQIAKDRATDKGNYEVTDDDAIQAIRKAVKQTEDTIAILAENHAEDGDLYVRSARELTILKNLLPQGPDAKTISRFVQDYLVYSNTERNIKAMGPIMKSLGDQYGAALDRGMASQIVRIELIED
jgi:uncharacterized protein YqeY